MNAKQILPALAACLLMAGAASAQQIRRVYVEPFPSGGMKWRTFGAFQMPYQRDIWCDCLNDCDSIDDCRLGPNCGTPDSSSGSNSHDPGWLFSDGDGVPACEDTWSAADTEYHPRVCVESDGVSKCGGASIRTPQGSGAGIPGADVDTWADAVFVILGQSNAQGGSTAPPIPLTAYERTHSWGWTDYPGGPLGGVQKIVDPRFGWSPRFNRFVEDGPEDEFQSPWPGFVRTWLNRNPSSNVFLVQLAIGGTCLADSQFFTPPRWNPGAVGTTDDGGTSYERFIDNMEDVSTKLSLSTVTAYLWDQGECDSGEAVTAAEYQAALEDLHDAQANDLAGTLTSPGSIPLYAAKIDDVNADDDAINTGIDNAVGNHAGIEAGPDRRATAVSNGFVYEGNHVRNVGYLGACWASVVEGGNTDCSDVD